MVRKKYTKLDLGEGHAYSDQNIGSSISLGVSSMDGNKKRRTFAGRLGKRILCHGLFMAGILVAARRPPRTYLAPFGKLRRRYVRVRACSVKRGLDVGQFKDEISDVVRLGQWDVGMEGWKSYC